MLALAAGVDMDNAFEEVEVAHGKPPGGRDSANGGFGAATRRIERNAVAALLARAATHDDSKPNLVAAAHLLMDAGASPSRLDSGAPRPALLCCVRTAMCCVRTAM